MNHALERILSVLLILFSFVIAHQSQTKPADRKTVPEITLLPRQDISTWQTISLDGNGKGIKFKLPPDWRHVDPDLESKKDKFTITEVDWSKPNEETAKTEMIRIYTTTIPGGLMSWEQKPESRKEALEEKFEMVTRSAQDKDSALFTDIKKLTISGVEGIFRVLHLNSQDKDIGIREGILWTGYRYYQGNAQEIDINISANPKSDALLRTILSTLEFEHDKDPISKP